MKTILVVFVAASVSMTEAGRMKKYAFNTKADVKVGDMLESEEYNTNMMVVYVFDKEYSYYNSATGDLTEERVANSNVWVIKELVIGEKDANVVYASRLNKE